MLSMDATNLHKELGGNLLEFFFLLSQVWQLDVNRSSEGRAKIGGARSDVAKALVVRKLGNLFNFSCCSGKTGENCTNISTWLH